MSAKRLVGTAMNRDEAKQVLLLYRPGTAEAEDPEIVAAMEVARRDPELGAWFHQHVQFQTYMRGKLRAIEVPRRLKTRLLARAASLSQSCLFPPRPGS